MLNKDLTWRSLQSNSVDKVLKPSQGLPNMIVSSLELTYYLYFYKDADLS